MRELTIAETETTNGGVVVILAGIACAVSIIGNADAIGDFFTGVYNGYNGTDYGP